MSADRLSGDIWAGKWRWLLAPFGYSTLAEAKREYRRSRHLGIGPMIAYASALYSVRNNCFAQWRNSRWKVWYLPLALYAFVRLVRHLLRETDFLFKPPYHAPHLEIDEIETLTAILMTVGSLPVFEWTRWADTLRMNGAVLLSTASGMENVAKGLYKSGGHTQALLDITWMKWALRYPHEQVGTKTREWAESVARDLLPRTRDLAARIEDPNQKSRVYRGLAEVYHLLGDTYLRGVCLRAAEAVPNIAQSVIEKNAAARKRMGHGRVQH